MLIPAADADELLELSPAAADDSAVVAEACDVVSLPAGAT